MKNKPPFPGNRQTDQNQYRQYPGGPQIGAPQSNAPQPGGPAPGWPGYPPPKRPGWVEEEKGTYILGDKKVDKDRFEERREDYTVLYELNIVTGHGNGPVNGMDFDSLEKWYGD